MVFGSYIHFQLGKIELDTMVLWALKPVLPVTSSLYLFLGAYICTIIIDENIRSFNITFAAAALERNEGLDLLT